MVNKKIKFYYEIKNKISNLKRKNALVKLSLSSFFYYKKDLKDA